MKLYRIANWSVVFENNRSRAIEKLSWVAVPNHHDGEHFSAIMQHPDGAKIYTAWMLIVQVASKCRPRGTLVRDDGRPLDATALSLKTRAPSNWFETALDFLEKSTDWLQVEELAFERHPDVSQTSDGCASRTRAHAPIPSHSVLSHSGGVGDQSPSNAEPPFELPSVEAGLDLAFAAFWAAYPKKVGKDDAKKAFGRARIPAVLAQVMVALEKQKQTDQWTRNGGQFIPNPSTYINQGRWKDDISTYATNQRDNRKSNPRLENVTRGPTDYAELAKRKAAMVGQVDTASNGTSPSVGTNGM